MCIYGCSVKLRLADEENFAKVLNDETYLVETHIIPKENWANCEGFLKPILKDLSLLKNTHIFQGSVIYASGQSPNPEKYNFENFPSNANSIVYHGKPELADEANFLGPSLRPKEINEVVKGEVDDVTISVNFVFSRNDFIKGYMYANDEWIHVLSKQLTTKFVKNYKNVNRVDKVQGVNICYVEMEEDIPDFSSLKTPCAILCKDEKLLDRMCNSYDESSTIYVDSLE